MNLKTGMILALIATTMISHRDNACSANKKGAPVMKKIEEKEIPFTEDLMREHGLLNRVLLVYEEVTKRIEEQGAFPQKALSQAVSIIEDFIENYHEKLEEDYIFPLFEKHKKQVTLVKTLRKQHIKGRAITAKLKAALAADISDNKKTQKQVFTLLNQFIKMYRPHEAREDTVLFPQVRYLMNEKEFEEMGEKFEDLEYKFFGKEGFFGMVDKVATIEKELGIYKLEQFTP